MYDKMFQFTLNQAFDVVIVALFVVLFLLTIVVVPHTTLALCLLLSSTGVVAWHTHDLMHPTTCDYAWSLVPVRMQESQAWYADRTVAIA